MTSVTSVRVNNFTGGFSDKDDTSSSLLSVSSRPKTLRTSKSTPYHGGHRSLQGPTKATSGSSDKIKAYHGKDVYAELTRRLAAFAPLPSRPAPALPPTPPSPVVPRSPSVTTTEEDSDAHNNFELVGVEDEDVHATHRHSAQSPNAALSSSSKRNQTPRRPRHPPRHFRFDAADLEASAAKTLKKVGLRC